MRCLQRGLEMYIVTCMCAGMHLCKGTNLSHSSEVWQEWKNKRTTSLRLEACVFIDEAYGHYNSPLASINMEHRHPREGKDRRKNRVSGDRRRGEGTGSKN